MDAPETWTVGRLIRFAAGYLKDKGSLSPRLDAELLLAHGLGMKRLSLYLDFDRPLDESELAGFKALLQRRAKGEPVAYILGRKGFYNLEVAVTPAVLIPRPETEHLVEAALELLPPESTAPVLDLGTGSGAIALALAHERPGLKLTATDLSPEAVAVAQANAAALGLAERVEFLQGDLFAPLAGRSFGLILSNPPYVSPAEHAALGRGVREFEPALALLAGPDGLAVIRRLTAEAPAHLDPEGWLILEIGAGQGPAVKDLLNAGGFREITIKRDLAGHERVAQARRRP